MSDETENGYPPVLAIAWGKATAPRRGPRRELTHEQIVARAIEIADADGLGAVTMQKVAAALGFTTMSLYRYVATKDDLLTLMLDAAMEFDDDLERAITGANWRADLRTVANAVHGLYVARPWVLDLPVSFTSVVMPNGLRVADLAFRAMRNLALEPSQKVMVLLSLTMFVRSFAALDRDLLATEGTADPDVTAGLAQLIGEVVTSERFPDLAPVLPGAFVSDEAPDSTQDYEFGLERLLDGIERYVDSGGQS